MRFTLFEIRTRLRRNRKDSSAHPSDASATASGDPKGLPASAKGEPDAEQLQLHLVDLPAGLADPLTAELWKVRYSAQVNAFTKHLEEEGESRKAHEAADLQGLADFHKAMVETAKGTLDRSRQAAESVRNAAAAIGVIYAAILGVAFSVDKPLPPRGVISAVFLALAIVLATAYVGWLPTTVEEASGVQWPNDTGNLREDAEVRTSTFIKWMRRASLERGRFLRGAVLALGFGVVFLAVAFVSVGSQNAPSTSEAALQAFPSPPSGVPADQLDFEKALYQAKVSEVADVRKEQLQATPGESPGSVGFWLVYGTAVLGLLLVLVTVTRVRIGSAPEVEP